MQVKVLFFGRLAHALGTEQTTLDVTDGATVQDAIDRAAAALPGLQPHVESGKLAYALNLSYTTPSEKMSAGDELAIIPPVSGG